MTPDRRPRTVRSGSIRPVDIGCQIFMRKTNLIAALAVILILRASLWKPYTSNEDRFWDTVSHSVTSSKKVAVLMMHDASVAKFNYFFSTLDANCFYARKYVYDCLLYTDYPDTALLNRIASNLRIFPFPLGFNNTLHFMWKKQFVIGAVLMVRKTENQTTTLSADEDVDNFLYDAVFYLDTDACFVIQAPPIQKLLGLSDANIFLARDLAPRHRKDLNAGVMCVRNTRWSRWFFSF